MPDPTQDIIVDPYLAIGELCRRTWQEGGGLEYFVRTFWNLVVSQPLEWAPHLTIFCREQEAIYRRMFMQYQLDEDGDPFPIGRLGKLYDLVLNVPPGTTKSTICTVMAPAWGWGYDPTLRFVCASHTDSLALGHSKRSLLLIQSAKYMRCFPGVRVRKGFEAAGNFTLTAGGQRFTTSTGAGNVTGEHGDILIFDDLIDANKVKSKAEILQATSWQNESGTRKTDKEKSVTINVMQRLDMEDPAQAMLNLRKEGLKVRHVCLPGILDDNVTPKAYREIYTFVPADEIPEILQQYKNTPDGIWLLDPKRLRLKGLMDLHIRLGTRGFAGQIQQRPAPKGGLIWKRWFNAVPDELFPPISALQNYGNDWDLAYTKDDENAASAVWCTGVLNNRVYVDRVEWDWKEFPELIKWMKTFPGPHYIEAKASGKSAKQTLSTAGVVAIEVQVNGEGDKVARANFATPPVESGVWYVRASILEKIYTDARQGILNFPNNPLKDVADSLAQAVARHFRGGKLVVADNTTEWDGQVTDDDDTFTFQSND